MKAVGGSSKALAEKFVIEATVLLLRAEGTDAPELSNAENPVAALSKAEKVEGTEGAAAAG